MQCRNRGPRTAWCAQNRQWWLMTVAVFAPICMLLPPTVGRGAAVEVDEAITGGLDWLVATQSRRGSWAANEGRYPTAMTALAGTALLLEGSTPTQGRYAEAIARAVDYLISRSRPNGLIGDRCRQRSSGASPVRHGSDCCKR